MAVRDVHIMPSKRFNLHSWRSDGLKLSLMVAMLMAFGSSQILRPDEWNMNGVL